MATGAEGPVSLHKAPGEGSWWSVQWSARQCVERWNAEEGVPLSSFSSPDSSISFCLPEEKSTDELRSRQAGGLAPLTLPGTSGTPSFHSAPVSASAMGKPPVLRLPSLSKTSFHSPCTPSPRQVLLSRVPSLDRTASDKSLTTPNSTEGVCLASTPEEGLNTLSNLSLRPSSSHRKLPGSHRPTNSDGEVVQTSCHSPPLRHWQSLEPSRKKLGELSYGQGWKVESGSGRLSHFQRTRSITGLQHGWRALDGAAVEDPAAPSHGQASDPCVSPRLRTSTHDAGFQWPSALEQSCSGSGRLVPRVWPAGMSRFGSLRGLPSPRKAPPPPLQLGPLVAALEGSDIDAIRDAALNVRIALKGCAGNKSRLIQAGGIPSLIQLAAMSDSCCVEHGITGLFNVCRVEGAAEEIEAAGGLQPVVSALSASCAAARENAAAAIFCLSEKPKYRDYFFKAGSVPLLVDLLRTGTVRGKKDAALALFNILKNPEAVVALVAAEGVEVLLSHLQSSEAGLEDKVMAVLSLVCKVPEGQEAVLKHNGLLSLIDVLELATQRAREDAVSALFNICSRDADALANIAEEGIIPALHKVCQSPSERAKAKAQALLQLLRCKP